MQLLILALPGTGAATDELYALGGWLQSSHPNQQSYSWQLEYRHNMFRHLAAGVSYLNEGHIRDHRRDGYTAQIWGRAELFDSRLTLALGAGPYFFLDTTNSQSPGGYADRHGWKAMVSGAATWHTESNLLLELRSNWVQGGSDFNTISALAGLGFQFDPVLEPLNAALAKEQALKNEVTLFVGRTIVNSFDSEHSLAGALEYRRQLSRHLDWTASLLYEGDNRLVRRNGLISQIWAGQQLLDDTFSVAAGAGLYLNLGHYHNPKVDSEPLSGIISLSGSYRVWPHWALRITWNRIVTSNERDADVILGGVGYRF